MSTRIAAAMLAALLIVPAPSGAQGSQQIKGQKPILILDGTFRFTPGAWATYVIHDKGSGEYHTFTMSVLNDETRKNRQGTWLEIDIDTGRERVVTRVLAEQTPAGPGEIMDAVVWIEGMKPFSVPEKYLKGDGKEVGQFQVAQVPKVVEPRAFTHDGQPLRGFFAESADDKGGVTRALVSTEVAPIGLVWADAPAMEMYLYDWGGGARTRITDRPIGMRMWIMDMVFRGLAGEDISIPERKLPQPAIDGGWEERDGACAGSRWTVGPAGGAGRTAESAARCGERAGREAVQPPAWKTPRIVAGQLESPIRNGAAQLMFVSDTRALMAVKTPDGVPASFSVLTKRQ